MTGKMDKAKVDRTARLAAELRENLKRRKDQARARGAEAQSAEEKPKSRTGNARSDEPGESA